MKSKIFTSLLLTISMSCGFSASTLAQRADLVEKAFKETSIENAIKEINDRQQSGDVKADDQNYVVVLKKQPDGSYMRVAHAKKEKVNQPIESMLNPVMVNAEEKLAGGNGPVDFEFTAGDKKLYAVIEKHEDCLIFNICTKKDEMEGFLKAKSSLASTTASSESKSEPKEEPKQEKKEEVKPAPSVMSALTSASIASSPKEEKVHTSASATAEVKNEEARNETAASLDAKKVHAE